MAFIAALFAASIYAGAAEANPVDREREAARLNNLGAALMNQQLGEKAAEQFAAAHRLDSKLIEAQVNEGIALLYQQKLPEAKAAFTAAVQQAPSNPYAWYGLGLLYRNDNESQEALKAFQKVLALDQDDADAHYFVASVLFELHDVDRSVTEFESALRLNPHHASAEFGLARALLRQGKTAEAHAALDRFQHITAGHLGFPMSHTYGEEGRYGKVEDAIATNAKAGPMIPVTFTRAWTLTGAEGGARLGPAAAACAIDTFGKGKLDLVVVGNGKSAVRVYRGADSGNLALLEPERVGILAAGNAVGCAAGDFDNDGLPDLAIALSDRVLLFRNRGDGSFEDVTTASGLHAVNAPTSILFVDYDHDGDLDLFVTGAPRNGSGANVLWRNNGDKTFTDWTKEAALGGSGMTTAALLSDLNNDRAVDLLVTGLGPAPTWYANRREGEFLSSPLFTGGELKPTNGAAILDFDKDGWMDVALVHSGAPGLTLWKNGDGKRFEQVRLPMAGAGGASSVVALDFDNDGWVDLAVLAQTESGPEVRLLRNLGPAGFEDVTHDVGLSSIKLEYPSSLMAVDLDRDGDADLVVTQGDGSAIFLRNDGGNRNHALRISLTGLADNKSGVGTKVEVFSGGLRQKYEATGASEILAGLGSSEKADTVRLLWPTGVPQDEVDLTATKPAAIAELDRRGSSCPTLFAWDGEKYGFVADVIGAAVIGHWVSPTERNIADPDEWIKIDGAKLKERDGYLSLRFGEPMEEVNYVDQVRLVAVDHPAGSDVYPNEGFRSSPPFAQEATVATAHAHSLAGAWDDRGRDVLETLRSADRMYVKDFTNLAFAGFANTHTLTMDLGPWTPKHPLRLLMHGFIEYFSASSMYAAWQSGLSPTPPYVEALLADGSWHRVVEDMGFPAGLPRTVVVDLTGKLPAGTRRIRVVTNLQIYWDQVQVDNDGADTVPLRRTELTLAGANLAFRGYPKQQDGKTAGDLTYDYQRASFSGPFIAQTGAYTRYGEVTPLLKKADDEFVIFGTGEDIDLEFGTASLPALPSGWVRDYFFYANGFVKDMDFYEASPFAVESLPFHKMRQYPYTSAEHYPDDPQHLAYRLDWNTRFESGVSAKPYQFRYGPRATDTPHIPGVAAADNPQAHAIGAGGSW